MQVSRTEQKRRAKEVEQLIAGMAGLPSHLLKKAPCSEEAIRELLAAAALKGGARKRQLKYVAKLLRTQPLEDLYSFMAQLQGAKLQADRQLHQVEYLRNALVDEAIEQYRLCRLERAEWEEEWPSQVVDEIRSQLPEADARALLRLAHLFARTRNPRHSREIFRLLRAASDLNAPVG